MRRLAVLCLLAACPQPSPPPPPPVVPATRPSPSPAPAPPTAIPTTSPPPPVAAILAEISPAALIHLASAPSSPGDPQLLLTDLGNDTTLRWTASPEPDVAGYELLRRDTTAANWQHADDLGAVTTITVPHSKDDWFFAVRAYDRDGYRSPAAFPRVADR